MRDKPLLDAAIDAGALLDWVTPSLSLLGGGKVLAVPRDEQADTVARLAAVGVKVRHTQIVDGLFVFDVRPGDFDAALSALGAERRTGVNCAVWLWTLLLVAFVVAVVALLAAL